MYSENGKLNSTLKISECNNPQTLEEYIKLQEATIRAAKEQLKILSKVKPTVYSHNN